MWPLLAALRTSFAFHDLPSKEGEYVEYESMLEDTTWQISETATDFFWTSDGAHQIAIRQSKSNPLELASEIRLYTQFANFHFVLDPIEN